MPERFVSCRQLQKPCNLISAKSQMYLSIDGDRCRFAQKVKYREFICGALTIADKPDYKSFKFIDNSEEMRGLKGDKRTAMENRQKGDGISRNKAGSNDSVAWEDSRLETQSATSPSETEENMERKKFSTENTVVDSDKPDLVVFLQDSSYQFVKDFFMDREVPSQSRCWAENFKLEHISRVPNSDDDSNSESTRETLETVSSTSNESKRVLEHDCKREAIKNCDPGNLVTENEQDSDDNLINSSTGKIVRATHLLREVSTKKTELVPSKTEEIYNSCTIESGSIIHHSDSSETTVSSQNTHEESSSVVVGRPLSDRISYSGRLPCSGSTSLRSNSSSSHSFPKLPSEWNGSPVRMVEADQKQLGRHQSWRICFFCCKF